MKRPDREAKRFDTAGTDGLSQSIEGIGWSRVGHQMLHLRCICTLLYISDLELHGSEFCSRSCRSEIYVVDAAADAGATEAKR